MLQDTIDNSTELLARHTTTIRRAVILQRWQMVMVALCWAAIFVALYFQFSATFTEFVLPLSLFGMLGGAGSWLVGRKRDRLIEEIKVMSSSLKRLQATFEEQVAQSKDRIPLQLVSTHSLTTSRTPS